MKNIIAICILLSITSCEFFEKITSKEEVSAEPLASVGQTKLYLTDIKEVIPKGLTLKDSLVFVKGYVNSWAKQQLLLQKAEENVSEVTSKEIESLVKNYKESLYINGYKERLVKQQLDTVITEEEIEKYYDKNKVNFKLSEELIQLKYIYYGKDFVEKKKLEKLFKSEKEADLDKLEEDVLNYKDYRLRDQGWLSYEEMVKKIPPFIGEPKEKLLKKSKFIQKEDSLGVYLVAVKEVLTRNSIAPMSRVVPQIKELVLHKRKLELIRDIEKTLIDDAIKNNNFKEY